MSYNVRYFGHATRGLATTSAAITRIARSIAALDPVPDVICLQEVETQSLRSSAVARQWFPEETQLDRLMTELHAALAILEKRVSYTAYYFPAHRYRLTPRTNIYTTGLAILARGELLVDHHNATRPHDITHRRLAQNLKQTRICAHLCVSRPGGPALDVFNTHLSLPTMFSRAFWTAEARMGFGPNQLAEARALADFLEAERRSAHMVVVGDFNALPGSPVLRYLTEERGLVDAFSLVHRMTPEESRRFPTAGFFNLRMHLDHVFSSPGLSWLDFEGTHRFGDEGSFAGLSDHVPIVGRCRVA